MTNKYVRPLIVYVAVPLLALALASPARAQVTFGLGGGPAIPAGNLSNAYTTGFDALINLGVRVPTFPLGFRADGMFDQFPGKSAVGVTGNSQLYSVSANAVLTTTGTPIIAPYLIGGVGYYNDHYRIEVSGASVAAGGSTSDNSMGINGGGGLRFGIGSLSVFAEARYHYVFSGPHHIELVPITFGVMF
jgi:hypothetical protein